MRHLKVSFSSRFCFSVPHSSTSPYKPHHQKHFKSRSMRIHRSHARFIHICYSIVSFWLICSLINYVNGEICSIIVAGPFFWMTYCWDWNFNNLGIVFFLVTIVFDAKQSVFSLLCIWLFAVCGKINKRSQSKSQCHVVRYKMYYDYQWINFTDLNRIDFKKNQLTNESNHSLNCTRCWWYIFAKMYQVKLKFNYFR